MVGRGPCIRVYGSARVFEAHKKGQSDYQGQTQFSRALGELDIDLIKARSPQAKGRVERSFGTAQDRWVKELRLTRAKTIADANEVLERLLPDHNRRFSVAAAQAGDANRPLGTGHRLAAILSIQEQRVVANDYTIRFENRLYQLDKPIYPGERAARSRSNYGSMAIRFGNHYLNYREILTCNTSSRDKERIKKDGTSSHEVPSSGVKPTNGRSGRTPAEPYPPVGEDKPTTQGPYRPAADHPWRRGFPRNKG